MMKPEDIEVRCPHCHEKFNPLRIEDTNEHTRNILIACKNFEDAAENLYKTLDSEDY